VIINFGYDSDAPHQGGLDVASPGSQDGPISPQNDPKPPPLYPPGDEPGPGQWSTANEPGPNAMTQGASLEGAGLEAPPGFGQQVAGSQVDTTQPGSQQDAGGSSPYLRNVDPSGDDLSLGGLVASFIPSAIGVLESAVIAPTGSWTPIKFPGNFVGANAVVLNGAPHDNSNPSDNHRGGRYSPAFRALGIPQSQMFDFNESGHGFPGYADNLRAAIELARQKMNGASPLDVILYVHGGPGIILVGERGSTKVGVSLDPPNRAAYDRFVYNLKLLLTAPPDGEPTGRLFIVGCSVMTGAKGNAFCSQLQKGLGVPVYSSNHGSTDIQSAPLFNTPTLVISPGGSFTRPSP
jgi:hypothetical protein